MTRAPAIKAFDPDRDASPVPSPCINVCTMNVATGLCDGCLRTIDEIALWGTATENVKRAVWREIRRREEGLF